MSKNDKIFSIMKAVATAMEDEKETKDIPAAKLTENEVDYIKQLIRQLKNKEISNND